MSYKVIPHLSITEFELMSIIYRAETGARNPTLVQLMEWAGKKEKITVNGVEYTITKLKAEQGALV